MSPRLIEYKDRINEMTDEEKIARKKILLTEQCEMCGKTETMIFAGKRICSQECYDRLVFRDLLPDYIDVIIRRHPKFAHWRTTVLEKNLYTCQKCGNKVGLEVHHKKGLRKIIKEIANNKTFEDLYFAVIEYKPVWNIDNGITLCKKCHRLEKRV